MACSLVKEPSKITLPDVPAPTAKSLEDFYYLNTEQILEVFYEMIN